MPAQRLESLQVGWVRRNRGKNTRVVLKCCAMPARLWLKIASRLSTSSIELSLANNVRILRATMVTANAVRSRLPPELQVWRHWPEYHVRAYAKYLCVVAEQVSIAAPRAWSCSTATGIQGMSAPTAQILADCRRSSTDLQAMARIHRVCAGRMKLRTPADARSQDGQKRPCYIYRYLTTATIDESALSIRVRAKFSDDPVQKFFRDKSQSWIWRTR